MGLVVSVEGLVRTHVILQRPRMTRHKFSVVVVQLQLKVVALEGIKSHECDVGILFLICVVLLIFIRNHQNVAHLLNGVL